LTHCQPVCNHPNEGKRRRNLPWEAISVSLLEMVLHVALLLSLRFRIFNGATGVGEGGDGGDEGGTKRIVGLFEESAEKSHRPGEGAVATRLCGFFRPQRLISTSASAKQPSSGMA